MVLVFHVGDYSFCLACPFFVLAFWPKKKKKVNDMVGVLVKKFCIQTPNGFIFHHHLLLVVKKHNQVFVYFILLL